MSEKLFSEDSVKNIADTIRNEYLSDYQAVEYIQSSGTQYIDTGVLPTNLTNYEIVFEGTQDISSFTRIFGSRENYGSKSNGIVIQASSKFRFGYGTQEISLDYPTYSKNTKYTFTKNDNTFNINGTISTPTKNTFSSSYSIYLFSSNFTGVVGEYFIGKVYSFKIWEDTTLIREFIPCYNKHTLEVGMFDRVEGKFYSNLGTDSFTKGEDIDTNVRQYKLREMSQAIEDMTQDNRLAYEKYIPYTEINSTDVYVEDTANLPMRVNVFGNVEQDTRERV